VSTVYFITTPQNDDEFLIFEDAANIGVASDSQEITVKQECLEYLKDSSREISVLQKYPSVKKVFIKYNTPLPSSGPVERLFSYSNMILNAKRQSLSDSNFENLLLLKVNHF